MLHQKDSSQEPSRALGYQMRSFYPTNFLDQRKMCHDPATGGRMGYKPELTVAVGFQCDRETLDILSSDGTTGFRLREKRYSAELNVHTAQRPCGKFTLLTAADWLGRDPWTNSLATLADRPDRKTSWAIYGIFPAGLYTGISALQVQICALIDTWEADWSHTIAQIDDVVSVQVSQLHPTILNIRVRDSQSV